MESIEFSPRSRILSTPVLKLMKKGTTAIQNVAFLKSALELGIDVDWNLLVGFPGERKEHYQSQLRTIKLITHLAPPGGCGRIRMDRFSPYFWQPAEFGMSNVRPYSAYALIYPPEVDLNLVAYYFDYDAHDTLPDAFHMPLYEEVRRWQGVWRQTERPSLRYEWVSEHLRICDARNPGSAAKIELDASAGVVYELCGRRAHSLASLRRELQARELSVDSRSVEPILDGFVTHGLMLHDDDRFLSLATPMASLGGGS